MGLEDRDYLREEARRYGQGGGGGGFYSSDLSGPPAGKKRMVTILVVICVVLYFADAFTPIVKNSEDGPVISNRFFDLLALKADQVFSSNLLDAPWNVYQVLTYGFAHMSMSTPRSIFHIFGNMLVLWMLGRMVEDKYGRYEFLYLFLAGIIFSGIVWGLINLGSQASMVGASGSVTAVVVLFALTFPHQKVYLFGVLEIPGWVVGVLVVGQDFILALINPGDRVAYEAHLGGAAFGAMYYYSGMRFEKFVPTSLLSKLFGRQPKLRVHNPDDDQAVDPNYQRDAELADEILEKVHREGEDSLTRKERKILNRYSKRVRKKRTD